MDDPRTWIAEYEHIKRQITQQRATGDSYSSSEVSSTHSKINKLESALKNAKASNTIPQAEIARRQVLVASLKKQLINAQSIRTGFANTSAGSDQAMLMRQKDIMALQDDMLNEIEKGVDRVMFNAKNINQEAQVHNTILDNMEQDVDKATDSLRQEAKHAEQIREKSQACFMYICIAIELILLVILIVFGFT